MGSKLGFILSLLFLVPLFGFVGDLIGIQFTYTNLDAVSVSVGYLISQKGYITDEAIELVRRESGGEIEQIGDTPAILGELFEYRIFKPFDTLIISSDVIEVAVTRSVVIGFYN